MENKISAILFLLPVLSLLAILFLFVLLPEYLGIGSRPGFGVFVRETYKFLKKKSQRSLLYKFLTLLWWIAWISIVVGVVGFVYYTFSQR